MTTKSEVQGSKTKRKVPPALKGAKSSTSQVSEAPSSGVSVRDLRGRLGLTQELFARVSGHSTRTIAEWERTEKPAASVQRLTEIQRLQRALAGVMRADFIGAWLETPNEAFSGMKPIEVIERGEVDRIWRMIYELESGAPT